MTLYDNTQFDPSKYTRCTHCGNIIFLGESITITEKNFFCQDCLSGNSVNVITLTEKTAETYSIPLFDTRGRVEHLKREIIKLKMNLLIAQSEFDDLKQLITIQN